MRRDLTPGPFPAREGEQRSRSGESGRDASPSRVGRGTEGVGPRGFTIIEVMVAMLIFAISIVSIFGAQFAAVSTAEFARRTGMASELVRCRMSELELEFATNGGFEEGDVTQSGPCCEMLDGDANADDYTCTWEIKTIQLPDINQMLAGGTDGGPGGGMFGDMLGLGGMGEGDDDDQSGTSGAGAGGAMGMVSAFLPTVTGMLQQAIRRVTVTAEWEIASGDKRDLSIVQYVVHPTQGPLQLLQNVNTVNEQAEALGLGEDATSEEAAGGQSSFQATGRIR
jgi:prepilin-type N-terminal cleavage/methylation domain-containing protein